VFHWCLDLLGLHYFCSQGRYLQSALFLRISNLFLSGFFCFFQKSLPFNPHLFLPEPTKYLHPFVGCPIHLFSWVFYTMLHPILWCFEDHPVPFSQRGWFFPVSSGRYLVSFSVPFKPLHPCMRNGNLIPHFICFTFVQCFTDLTFFLMLFFPRPIPPPLRMWLYQMYFTISFTLFPSRRFYLYPFPSLSPLRFFCVW